jgi:hypothetical protein
MDERRVTEANLGVHVLNRMLELGRPSYVRGSVRSRAIAIETSNYGDAFRREINVSLHTCHPARNKRAHKMRLARELTEPPPLTLPATSTNRIRN